MSEIDNDNLILASLAECVWLRPRPGYETQAYLISIIDPPCTIKHDQDYQICSGLSDLTVAWLAQTLKFRANSVSTPGNASLKVEAVQMPYHQKLMRCLLRVGSFSRVVMG
jgi:hypothetical protein